VWLGSATSEPTLTGVSISDRDPVIAAELEKFTRIGIILAGGGAKGAYQAGALRAIHQFLRKYEALDKVKMIAGTSIGSWNALFWLAGLIGGEGEHDPLELWWSNIHLTGLIEPAKYALGQNFFLTNQPWQDQFNAMFLTGPYRERLERHVVATRDERDIHFYFTRTNVGRARLEFTTNREDLDRVKADVQNRPAVKPGQRRGTVATCIEDIRFAVFSSMTLPPLFEYMTTPADDDPKDIQYYEDGGVIDNLPVAFGTEVEGSELLFVLPLNASFEEEVNPRWMWRRLSRVINIRQGVLEQKALGELQRLNEVRESYGVGAQKPVSVFALCPQDNALVGTGQFWNRGGAAKAFNLMYDATRKALGEKFVETVRSSNIAVHTVDANGDVHRREL
jgi:predicted acylesterase/phospholipase RssA